MQTNWLWGFDQFINDITTPKGESMKTEKNGWGDSMIATKYVYQKIYDILDENYADSSYELSRFMDELAHNYHIDTGRKIKEDL